MAVEGINAFQNFSNAVNFHQATGTARSDKKSISTQSQHTSLPPKKDNTTPIVVGAIALAALGTGIYAHKTGKLGDIFSTRTQRLTKKVNKLINQYMNKAKQVINENTHGGMINLPGIDEAAGRRSADINKTERFHQAATWLEEAYKTAFSKAQLSDGKNMFNYIHEYMKGGKTALAQMYVQMPEAEANIRINKFLDDIKQMDNHTGMTAEEFLKDLTDVFMPQAREAIK